MSDKNDKLVDELAKAINKRFGGYEYEDINTAPEQLSDYVDFGALLKELSPEALNTLFGKVETKPSDGTLGSTKICETEEDEK